MKLDEVPAFIKEMYKDINAEKEEKHEKQLWDIFMQERHFLIMTGEKLMSFDEFKKKLIENSKSNKKQSQEEILKEALESEQAAIDMLESFT